MTGYRRIHTVLALSTAVGALLTAASAHAQAVPETNAQKDSRAAGQQQETETPPPSPAAPVDPQVADAPAPEGQAADIIVTGFRQSLNSAINLKRNETASIDAIKAEDIAEFPDLNLAESLQRIPGVTINRVNGEGRNISVRGLGPEYTRVRINGMEAIGTTGGTDNSGGVNRGRGFDFNIFSSDLFNSLAVRKTATADVEEGSLGATVDLQIARPFDYKKPTVALSAQASYNDLREKATPRISGLVSVVTDDKRFGVLLSVSYEERKLREEGANITRWSYGGFNGGFNAASTLSGYSLAQINNANPDTALFHPRIPGLVSYDIDQKRLGAAAAVQFAPTDMTLLSIDGLYSRLDGTRQESQFQAISFSRSGTGKPQTIIRSGTVDRDNNIISGTFDNVDLRTQSRYDELQTDFYQVTATLDQKFGERLKFGSVVGYSKSAFDNPVQTTVTIDAANTQGFFYDFSQGRFPVIRPGVNIADPATFAFTNGTSEVRIRPQTVDNDFANAKGFLEWKTSSFLTVKGGVDWRRFRYSSTEQRRLQAETVVQPLTPAQLAAGVTTFDGFGKGLNVPGGTPTSWVVPNLDTFISQYGIYGNPIYTTGGVENATARGSYITVEEQDLGAYGMASFNFADSGLPIRGDIGVRYVNTDQTSTGYASQGAQVNLVTAKRSYDRWLPSGNLVLDVTDNLLVRFAAAKTLARAGISSITPGGNLSISGGNRGFSSGNPDLNPTESDNIDVAVEWYPTKGAIYAVAAFRKDIGTFVQTLSTQLPFSALGLPNSLLPGNVSPSDIFIVSQPVNSSGGRLRGFEVNVQQPFTFLPGFLSNFGVLANYTWVDSNIEYLTSATGGASVREPLVGLSKHAANGTLYFETEKFAIRGSVAYRSKYLTAVPGTEGNAYNGTNSTTNFDAQVSYNITDRVKVSLEAINLTDQKNDQFVDETNRLNVLTHTGRQFFLGARYSF